MAFVLFTRVLNVATRFFARPTRAKHYAADDTTQPFLYTAYLR